MNSTEFYVPREDWPQQPDEKCTLESITLPTQTKKKKASNASRAKKKMSESLAGVTAAAVTVVMLSTSIPALPSIPVFEEVVMDIPDYGRRETCPVCEQEKCSYFWHDFSGLRLSLEIEDYNREYVIWSTDDLAQIDSRALYEMAELMAQMDPEELEALYSMLSPEELEFLSNQLNPYNTYDTYDPYNAYDPYDDFQTMQGFCRHRSYIQAPIGCVETEEGQRLVLRLDNAITADLHDDWSVRGWQTILSDDSEDLYYSGLFIPLVNRESLPAGDITYDEFSASATDYIYAVVSYDKTGEDRLVDPYIYLLNYISYLGITSLPYNTITRDVPGIPNAQVQLVSSLDTTVMDELLEYCKVTVVNTKDQVFDLGRTMRFAETDSVYRTYGDWETDYLGFGYSFFEGAPGDFVHMFGYDFPFKSYAIGASNHILLSDVGWDNILNQVFELNQQAPETGHQVFFPIVELNPCTVNGITYRCYLIYHEETYYHTYDALCFMVPQQEMEVAVQFEATLSAEQLETLLDTRDPATAFEISELLNQITLR